MPDSAARAPSGSTRHQHSKDDGHAGSTCSRHAVDAAKPHKSPMMLDSVGSNKRAGDAQASMPAVVKSRHSNNIYGTVKNDRYAQPVTL